MEVLKVSSGSSPNSLAGAISAVTREFGAAEMHVVGAGALNQAVKAVAIARGYLAPSGLDIVMQPAFSKVEIKGEVRTSLRIIIELREAAGMNPHAAKAVSLAENSDTDSGKILA